MVLNNNQKVKNDVIEKEKVLFSFSLFDRLPDNVKSLVYQYDGTYHDKLSYTVLPELYHSVLMRQYHCHYLAHLVGFTLRSLQKEYIFHDHYDIVLFPREYTDHEKMWYANTTDYPSMYSMWHGTSNELICDIYTEVRGEKETAYYKIITHGHCVTIYHDGANCIYSRHDEILIVIA